MINYTSFYRKIPIYPEVASFADLCRKSKISLQAHGLRTDAPLAEDDKGRICYPTEKDKKAYLKKLKSMEVL